MEHDSQRTLIAIATYNERQNIERLLDAVLAASPSARVLVIDDSSPDGTGELVEAYAARDPRVRVLHRPRKMGLGSALLTAFGKAIEEGYDLVCSMDADFSHPPDRVPALIAGMDQYDVTIGSRYVPGGSIGGWDLKRHLMSRGINLYSRLLLGIKARDCSGGFRCYRVARLKEMDFSAVRSRGYSFMEEFLYRCQKAGCRIGETPIHFENRKQGKSKISAKEAIRALSLLLRISLFGR